VARFKSAYGEIHDYDIPVALVTLVENLATPVFPVCEKLVKNIVSMQKFATLLNLVERTDVDIRLARVIIGELIQVDEYTKKQLDTFQCLGMVFKNYSGPS
jgi:hypothetical protein